MSMTYLQMQNAVLADAFAESRRADAKTWLQWRHAALWDSRDWTFKYGTSASVSFDGTQTLANIPTDFKEVVALYDENGDQLRMIRSPAAFYDLYNPNVSDGSGAAEAFTVVDAAVILGPTPTNTGTGYLVYKKLRPTLSADGDLTGLPDGYDLALVHGAKAEGFRLANIPLWQGFEEVFNGAVGVLEAAYLAETDKADQLGAYRPGWY